MLTPEKIEELRGLLAKATPGPWKNHLVDDTTIVASNGFEIGTTWPGGSVYNGFVDPAEQHEINAALIVAMRNAIPALLDLASKAPATLSLRVEAEKRAREEATEDTRSLCRFILSEWGPDGALKATTYSLEQREARSAKGGDANDSGPSRPIDATSPGVTAGASTLEAAETHSAALARALEEAKEALRPFARIAEADIGEDEADEDTFRVMSRQYARAPLLTVGDLRRARSLLAPKEDTDAE